MSDPGETVIGGGITPENARKVLRANTANLIKKVQAGKMLNATEVAMIQAIADGADPLAAKGWAENKVELAAQLNITRMSVDNWLKEGAPSARSNGHYDVNAWRDWMRLNGKKPGKTGAPDGTGTDPIDQPKSRLEARRLLLMNEKLEHEISILKGEYTRNEDVEAGIRVMVVDAKKVLFSLPSALAPQVVGLTVPEAEKRLRAAIDEVVMHLHTGGPAAIPPSPAP